MTNKKMGIRKMKKVGNFFPEKTDIVRGDFSYADYIEDVNAFRQGVYQGYLANYDDIDLRILFSSSKDNDKPIENSHSDEEFQRLVAYTGDLPIQTYDKEIETLHKEFVERVLGGEKLQVVDQSISEQMEELATRNIDGSHASIESVSPTLKR